jgi:hypothetical protein
VKEGSFGKIERGRSTHKEKNEITLLLYKISIFVNYDEKRLLMELSILNILSKNKNI